MRFWQWRRPAADRAALDEFARAEVREQEAAKQRVLEAAAQHPGWDDDPTAVYPIVTYGQQRMYQVDR